MVFLIDEVKEDEYYLLPTFITGALMGVMEPESFAEYTDVAESSFSRSILPSPNFDKTRFDLVLWVGVMAEKRSMVRASGRLCSDYIET